MLRHTAPPKSFWIGFYLHSCARLGVRAAWLNRPSPDSLHTRRAHSLSWEHFCSMLWRRRHASPRKHGPPFFPKPPVLVPGQTFGRPKSVVGLRVSSSEGDGQTVNPWRTQGAADRQLSSSSRGGLRSCCVRGHRSRSAALDDRLRVADTLDSAFLRRRDSSREQLCQYGDNLG